MLRLLVVVVLMVVLLPVTGLPQAGSGQIQGVCRDPEGAAVPGVTVTIRQTETGTERVLKSDETGRFAAPFMPVGTYSIQADYPGMVQLGRTGLVLTVGATLDITLDMVPTALQQQVVTVVTETPLVPTSQTAVSTTMNSLDIQNLPVNGRRWENFVLLTPGVTNDGTFGLFSFHGIVGVFNNTMIDGVDNNQAFFAEERGRTRIPYAISQETVREFQVNTSNFSAEFGRSAGGVINAVTRSGTNDFHGSAFYYLRDRSFLARDPFARAQNQAKPPERRHQFGGSVGGPITRDKIFFFTSYDQQNRDFPVTVLPNGADNFYLGSTAPADATQRTVNFLRSMAGVFPRTANQNLGYLKLDWQLNDAHRLTSSLNILDFRSPNGVQTAAVVAVPNGSNGQDGVKNATSITTLTSVLTPSVVNEVRFQYSRDNEFQNPNGPGPSVTINNAGNSFQYGMPNFLPRPAYPNEGRFQFVDNFSFLRGLHDFKIGADINLVRDTFINIFQGGGVYAYTSLTNFALDYARVDTGANTGKHYNTFTQAFDVVNPEGSHRFHTMDYNFYGQDSWRITPTLTVNYGVRYEYQQLPQPTRINPLLPLTWSLHQDKNNFAPRLGLAWQFMPRTIFRMGYGLSYGRTEHSTISNFFLNNGVTQLVYLLNPATNLAASPALPDVFPRPPVGQQGAVTINLAAPDFVNPEVHQASAEVEHRIGSALDVSATYMMARGIHLPFTRDTNIAAATQTRIYNILDASGAVKSAIAVPFYNTRINPAFGQLLTYETGVSSWYNALILQANQRFSHNIQFTSSFTWSHALDDGQVSYTFLPGNSFLDPFNRRADYGNSATDQKKRFVFSGIWQPQIASSGLVGRSLLSGWKLGGIITLSDGFPQTGTVNLANLAGGLGSGLNAAQATNNRFPGMGRNVFARPGLANVDMRVTREFRFRETKSVEFLVEGFNVFNRVNYSTVNATQYSLQGTNLVPNPLFMKPQTALSYPSVGNPRQLQLALRLNF